MSNDLTAPAAYHTQAAVDFYLEQTGKGNRDNSVTVRSARAARMYDPGVWAPRVSPTPLLLIVADDDRLTLPASRRRPTNEPSTPERLTLIDGGHFAPYTTRFPTAAQSALDWFREHLT